ncbi:toll-like receptor 11 [Ornithorhynchus anatinus]|uniref:toll-like receptor 11 n=1 Tax=Ornithorhynchus anatinus TaxID=9258 RepID=UPI0010A8145A|nr:toll-like receptor 11 [Ornithorhynchus anatinus]
MGGPLPSPRLLFALLLLPPPPPATPPAARAWTVPGCTVLDSGLLPHARALAPRCPGPSGPSGPTGPGLLVACANVTRLATVLERVPARATALCLEGTVPLLPGGVFARFSELRQLRLQLGPTRVQQGAFRGLGALRQLHLVHLAPRCAALRLPPGALDPVAALRVLSFQGYCLRPSRAVRLPRLLRHLALGPSCLTQLQELRRLFPGLGRGDLKTLDVSANPRLRGTGPAGALRGLRLLSLKLDGTRVRAAELMRSGLRGVDALSLAATGAAQVPGPASARFQLLRLELAGNRVERLRLESLRGLRRLEALGLRANALRELPPGFLAALPRLRSLDLSRTGLGPAALCRGPGGFGSGPGPAEGGPGLRALDLSHNNLSALEPGAFACLGQLRRLRLEGNGLDHLQGGELGPLRRLRELELSGNPLGRLTPGWLAPLPALTALGLLDTNLHVVPGSHLRGPAGLRRLRLGTAGDLELYPPWPPALRHLELRAEGSYVQFTVHKAEAFPALETLVVRAHYLLTDPWNATAPFPALRRLDLRGCSPEPFAAAGSRHFFPALPRLERLRFRADGEGRGGLRLLGLPRLRVLELRDLGLGPAPPGHRSERLADLLGPLPALRVLLLHRVGLSALSAEALEPAGPGRARLRLVRLSSEEALEPGPELEERLPRLPAFVYFRHVSFACGCDGAWLGPWAARAPASYVSGLEGAECEARAAAPGGPGLLLFLASSALLLPLLLLPLLPAAALRGRASGSGRRGRCLLLRRLLPARRPRGPYRYDAFVAHCARDRGWVVRELLPALEEAAGPGRALRLCLPERDFVPGRARADGVAAGLAASRAALCVLSPRALRSPWLALALRLATQHLLDAPGPPRLLLLVRDPAGRGRPPGCPGLARLLGPGAVLRWPGAGPGAGAEAERTEFWETLRERLEAAGRED